MLRSVGRTHSPKVPAMSAMILPPEPPDESAGLERAARDIAFKFHCYKNVWIDVATATDVHRLAGILSRPGWEAWRGTMVRSFHLMGRRPLWALLIELVPDREAAVGVDEWTADSLLVEALANLAQGGSTALLLFDVGPYLADDPRGLRFEGVRRICDACSNARVGVVALSSDHAHPTAELLRSKFHTPPF